MSSSQHTRHVISVLMCAFVLSIAAVSMGQAPAKTVIGAGEVTGDDVYIRSGPSLNHYTISKLEAGSTVAVVGEREGWYEILPPAGVFSLISGDYVDTVDDANGVVNGNNVRVRAGSLLNKNKYTVQLLLSKGAEIQVLGRNPDGFLKIEPPAGATVWISSEYVDLQRGVDPKLAEASPAADEPGDSAAGDEVEAEAPGEAAPEDASPFAGAPKTVYRVQLEELDEGVRLELAKPLAARELKPFREQYAAIAGQEEDEIAQRYAAVRVDQLDDMLAMADAAASLRKLSEETESKRRIYLAARANIPTPAPATPSALDAKGELRASALYPPGSLPRRFRLVEPDSGDARTIGYIELRRDSSIRIQDYLGHLVGVRASEKHLQTGSVDAVPVYIVDELVLLNDETQRAAEED